MEIGLLSNQDTIASLREACMRYQSCLLILSLDQQSKHRATLYNQSCKSLRHAPQPSKDLKTMQGQRKNYHMSNVILVLVPIHQPIHYFVPNCMFLMTYTTIHFHFLHKLGLCIGQTTNLHSILASVSTTIYNNKTKNKGTLRKNVAHEQEHCIVYVVWFFLWANFERPW